jgi:LytS/YehU family sensor histidine kinase
VRLVLENSRFEKITVANELETLRLYIELEIMRFKHKVSYSIHVAGNIDTGYIEMPPLLLQPFVENAIWHGLMHKDLGGTVTVDLSQPGEHLLVVEITDDGVGREMAAIYKSKRVVRHKSSALKMTAGRVQTEILVTDLWDDDGKARGTKVTIHVPI